MRAHYLQHVPFEGLGNMEEWLEQQGFSVTATKFYQPLDRDNRIPGLEEFDFLIIMGGPMSVNDEADLPWLVQEKTFIRAAISSGKPILGVCLGAQLIASSLGAKVYPNAAKEIGWWPVRGKEGNHLTVEFCFPDTLEVFHWHGETFDLPPGARLLASSKACVNQAFAIGDSVVGLQFHLETTPASARKLVENCRDELVAGPSIQTERQILATEQQKYDRIGELMTALLTALTRNIARREI